MANYNFLFHFKPRTENIRNDSVPVKQEKSNITKAGPLKAISSTGPRGSDSIDFPHLNTCTGGTY